MDLLRPSRQSQVETNNLGTQHSVRIRSDRSEVSWLLLPSHINWILSNIILLRWKFGNQVRWFGKFCCTSQHKRTKSWEQVKPGLSSVCDPLGWTWRHIFRTSLHKWLQISLMNAIECKIPATGRSMLQQQGRDVPQLHQWGGRLCIRLPGQWQALLPRPLQQHTLQQHLHRHRQDCPHGDQWAGSGPSTIFLRTFVHHLLRQLLREHALLLGSAAVRGQEDR